MDAPLQIEPTGSAETGRCSCCGRVSRRVWGHVYAGPAACAAYFVHWTVGHVFDRGAHIDLVLGRWGDGTSAANRQVISLEYRVIETGPALMVIDAGGRSASMGNLASRALGRNDVIGRPVATEVFALCDAILAQDARLAALWETPSAI